MFQVYDGSRPWWTESDPTHPVNAYGHSKLEAEQHLAASYPSKHVVLRASLIYGPEPPLQAVGRPLFVQFVESQLAQGLETSFFVDEFRWVNVYREFGPGLLFSQGWVQVGQKLTVGLILEVLCGRVWMSVDECSESGFPKFPRRYMPLQQKRTCPFAGSSCISLVRYVWRLMSLASFICLVLVLLQLTKARLHSHCYLSRCMYAHACCCRSAVYVYDICEVVKLIISKCTAAAGAAVETAGTAGDACQLAGLPHSIYNMGGPERLSRHDMATAVAQHCGHSSKAIKSANTADVQR
jgi:hypothetical protein